MKSFTLHFVFLELNCRYQSCEPLILSCPSCSGTFHCPPVFSSICTSILEKSKNPQIEESISNFWHRLCCPKCPEEGDLGRISPATMANQVFMELLSYH